MLLGCCGAGRRGFVQQTVVAPIPKPKPGEMTGKSVAKQEEGEDHAGNGGAGGAVGSGTLLAGADEDDTQRLGAKKCNSQRRSSSKTVPLRDEDGVGSAASSSSAGKKARGAAGQQVEEQQNEQVGVGSPGTQENKPPKIVVKSVSFSDRRHSEFIASSVEEGTGASRLLSDDWNAETQRGCRRVSTSPTWTKNPPASALIPPKKRSSRCVVDYVDSTIVVNYYVRVQLQHRDDRLPEPGINFDQRQTQRYVLALHRHRRCTVIAAVRERAASAI
eukprot:CAMPEP_0178983198 /NCGR_PEP_ID=MMETSP0795-20121207/919_1 /TAXON_ID=88552 /ORGANISM="Amoebophrya sp., Strain Ameob2" /LENGTH=274 /DNA_ID=CAMNT_0020673929 /DNA_START=1 /DNA_END=825 /DNA_ORIENTATION=-